MIKQLKRKSDKFVSTKSNKMSIEAPRPASSTHSKFTQSLPAGAKAPLVHCGVLWFTDPTGVHSKSSSLVSNITEILLFYDTVYSPLLGASLLHRPPWAALDLWLSK